MNRAKVVHASMWRDLARLPAAMGFAEGMQRAGVPQHESLAVALSGGPDSMALALLASWWVSHRTPHHTLEAPPEAASSNRFPGGGYSPHDHHKAGALSDSQRARPELWAMVVDHGLREESSREAAEVCRRAARAGLLPHMMTCDWQGGLPSDGKRMEAARDARYAALDGACRTRGVRHLLLGHHAGDQAETVLMRLSRASGLQGLAGMAEVSDLQPRSSNSGRGNGNGSTRDAALSSRGPSIRSTWGAVRGSSGIEDATSAVSDRQKEQSSGWGGTEARSNQPDGHDRQVEEAPVRLVRPLLRVSKADLEEVCRCCGFSWVEDPSNTDEKYQRVSIRNFLASSCPSDSIQGDLLRISQASGAIAGAIRDRSRQLLRDAVVPPPQIGIGVIEGIVLRPCALVPLRASADPIDSPVARSTALAALSAVLQDVSGSRYPPRLRAIEQLLNKMEDGSMRGSFTAAGCDIRPVPGSRGSLVSVTRSLGSKKAPTAVACQQV